MAFTMDWSWRSGWWWWISFIMPGHGTIPASAPSSASAPSGATAESSQPAKGEERKSSDTRKRSIFLRPICLVDPLVWGANDANEQYRDINIVHIAICPNCMKLTLSLAIRRMICLPFSSVATRFWESIRMLCGTRLWQWLSRMKTSCITIITSTSSSCPIGLRIRSMEEI